MCAAAAGVTCQLRAINTTKGTYRLVLLIYIAYFAEEDVYEHAQVVSVEELSHALRREQQIQQLENQQLHTEVLRRSFRTI